MTQERQLQQVYNERPGRRPNKKKDDGLVIFVSAFFIMLLLFLAIAKQLSPDIDVNLDNVNKFEEEMDTKLSSDIDDRLKNLQEADKSGVAADDMFDYALEEKVKIPTPKKEEIKKEAVKKEEPKVLETKEELEKRKAETKKLEDLKAQKTLEAAKQVPVTPKAPALEPSQTAKVLVGRYPNEDQAQMAKSIIADSGLNVTPFVRTVNGVYTIQVGSFSTRENAQNLVNELLKNNYPARLIVE